MRKIRIDMYWMEIYVLLDTTAGAGSSAGARGHPTFTEKWKIPPSWNGSVPLKRLPVHNDNYRGKCLIFRLCP